MQGDLEASKSGAILLTKDNNMCLKAQANGLKAVPPAHFPAAQPHLHKQLLAISSETSPVRHTPAPNASPPPPPHLLSELSSNPSQGNVTLPTGPSRPASAAQGQSPAALTQLPDAPVPNKHDQHLQSSSGSRDFMHPADRLAHLAQVQGPQQQQAQQAEAQQLQQQQQQQLSQQLEDAAAGSFRLQGAPILPPGLVTGSHGYPRAPFSSPAHLQPSTAQQQSEPRLGLRLGLGLGLQQGFGGSDGSMQHQQGGFPGRFKHPTIDVMSDPNGRACGKACFWVWLSVYSVCGCKVRNCTHSHVGMN